MFHISVGGCHARHPSTFSMIRPRGLTEYLLLLVHSRAEFVIAGHTMTVSPDCALIIAPNTPYQYRALDRVYLNDWLHFSTTDPDALTALGISVGKPIQLPDASRFTIYLRQMLWESDYAGPRFAEANVNLLMLLLMHSLADLCCRPQPDRHSSPYDARLQELRLSLRADPGRPVAAEELADSLGVSLSYFQHLYTQCFGVSFQADRIRLRIDYAKELLGSTSLSVHEIAELCGYSNEVHFYRQFRQLTGMTPAACRKQT